MIQLLDQGNYHLVETKGHTKVLTLNKKKLFAWFNAKDIGDLLVASRTPHIAEKILAVGKYRLYDVKNEKTFTDLQHLELCVGNGLWQGYLLTSGLPKRDKRKSRIIPTKEIITISRI
jgi:hypothetical protein